MSAKIRIAVTATAALALAVPAVAVARHGHGQSHTAGRTKSTVSGTVASFTGGALTIERADGTMVSAKVTAATEIECEAAGTAMPTATAADHQGGGRSVESGDDQSGGRDDAVTETQTEAVEAPENEATEPAGHDQGDAAERSGTTSTTNTPTTCGRSALTTGTTVTRARITSKHNGPAVFTQIRLAV